MGTHYSYAQDAEHMAYWAKRAAQELVKKYKGKKHFVLLYSGLSGISAATALSLALNYYRSKHLVWSMAYVRKPNEKSHGCPVEHNTLERAQESQLPVELVFVDDFICSGETLRYCVRQFYGRFREYGWCPTWEREVAVSLSMKWDTHSYCVSCALEDL